MKIFSPSESKAPNEASAVKKSSKGRKRAELPKKSEITESAIRQKLASHVETSNTSKSQVIQKNSKALGSGFMSEEVKPMTAQISNTESPETEDKSSLAKSHLLLSDVKLNDPKDPNTQEKLKSVLSKGAFNFNPKEKETLEKILGAN